MREIRVNAKDPGSSMRNKPQRGHMGEKHMQEIYKSNKGAMPSGPVTLSSSYQTGPIFIETLRRPKLSDKHDWVAIHVLVARRGDDGVAPVVLEVQGGGCFRCPAPYEAGFELALLHLHRQTVPLEGGPCPVGALFQNRCQEALRRPWSYDAAENGDIEERDQSTQVAQLAPPGRAATHASEPSDTCGHTISAPMHAPAPPEVCLTVPTTELDAHAEVSARADADAEPTLTPEPEKGLLASTATEVMPASSPDIGTASLPPGPSEKPAGAPEQKSEQASRSAADPEETTIAGATELPASAATEPDGKGPGVQVDWASLGDSDAEEEAATLTTFGRDGNGDEIGTSDNCDKGECRSRQANGWEDDDGNEHTAEGSAQANKDTNSAEGRDEGNDDHDETPDTPPTEASSLVPEAQASWQRRRHRRHSAWYSRPQRWGAQQHQWGRVQAWSVKAW